MKRKDLARRAASAALAACMMFTLSAPALAASTDALLQQSTAAKSAVSVLDEENDMMAEVAYQMNLKDGSITVYIGDDGKQYAKQGDNEAQQKGNLWITTDGSPTNKTLTIEGGTTGAKVTLSNVNIDAPGAAVSVSGNVELVITGTNTLHSGENHAGVEKANDNGTLTISGTGTLEAYGGQGGAGVGSGSQKDCSNIVIESGTIIAHGGEWGAGIGSGNVGNRPGVLGGRNITINDGDVTAYGGSEAAGIGGGLKGNGKDITINGGTVRAESGGGKNVAAIGGGRVNGVGENIQITGGNVTVKSGTGVWIGGTNGEISKSSLTGAVTYQDGSGSVVDEVVQDYGLEVGAESTTPTRVTSKNYKDILDKGVLSYDPTTQTLKSNGKLPRSLQKINAPDKDIELKGENSSTVTDKLIVVNAHNVTISSDKYAAIFTRDDTSTINCTGKVAIRSDKDMAVNGSLNIYDSSEVTLSAGNSVVKDSANITSNGDVTIHSTSGRAAQKLTINKAQNVTITISDAERAVSENTDITASGTVILKNNAQGGHVGTVTFNKQADGKNYVYYTSEAEDAKLIDPRIHPLAEAEESGYLRIEPRKTTYSIEVANGTAQVDDDTTGLNTAFVGEKVTVTAAERGAPWTFAFWTVDEGQISGLTEEELKNETLGFTMPEGNVKLTAHYSMPLFTMDMPVTVTDGTINDGTENPLLVQPGTPITVKAMDKTAEYKMFHNWKVEENVSPALGLTQGSLGSENEFGTEKITFTMPQEAVTLTAEYVKMHLVTADGGIGTASVSGSKIIDGRAAAGSTVKVSAELDGDKYPGMMFDQWEVVSPDGSAAEVKLADATSSETTFTMPDCEVTLVAHWIDGAMPEKPGIDDLDPDFSVDDGSGIAGAIVAGTLIGGASVWGGYEITTRVILNDLLPEGAAIPANRGELAMLVWQTAGKPEPAAQPAFTDVADAELAKAAQWCVEQGLLDAKDGKFDPNGWMPKYKTIEVWKKAFPKQ